MTGKLLLGSFRYSSWSLRGWLAVRLAGLSVQEEIIPLKGGGKTDEIHRRSPNRLVPYLEHDGARVWESLAICLYCAELEPSLLPSERKARAHAYSISAQMHAGFRSLRQICPMDIGRVPAYPLNLTEEQEAGLHADLALLGSTLFQALTRTGRVTPYLFGDRFGIADCMYAPVMLRIRQYALETLLPAEVVEWCERGLAHPLMLEWTERALAEPEEWRLSYG
ncbi:glutathione S-transferase [Acetobacteraceae bacterium ESL0709]|nr:glutathione S-transferase [Acetobacteraceae bacterium ESL0697]MDF7677248.1 glutathione S-transferase [Acetobacteraceae bacterium ESL0709]